MITSSPRESARHEKSGLKNGKAQALSLTAQLELRDGNEELAFELLEQSIALSEGIGFTWWHAITLLELSELLLDRGQVPEADARAREALSLLMRIGDRQSMIYALAQLVRLATEAGRLRRAGRLWGAIEAEEARSPVGQWEQDRGDFAKSLLAYDGHEFARGRREGRRLSLDEAAEEVLRMKVGGP